MAGSGKTPFSTDTFLGVLGIIAGICGYVFELGWATKSFFVIVAIWLIVYAGRRHNSHPLLRYPVAIAVILVFAFFPWDAIWEDFHKSHPVTTWPEFIVEDWFHWALAICGSLALGWDWLPFWALRRRLFSSWSKALGEEVWLSRSEALKAIRSSSWGRLREPPVSIGDYFMRGLAVGKEPLDANEVKFKVFLNLTLDSFEAANPRYVREVDNKKEFLEEKLLLFVRRAMEEEVVKQFGPIPSSSV